LKHAIEIMQPSKKQVISGNPLDQKELVRHIFKFMPLLSVFSLSRVSHQWRKFLSSPEFHPKRILFYHSKPAVFEFEDDGSCIDMQEIPSSRMQDVANLVESITYYGGDLLDISDFSFSHVTNLELLDDFSLVEEFYLTLTSQLERLYITGAKEDSFKNFLRHADFSNVRMLTFDVLNPFFDVPHLDYKSIFPNLKVVDMMADGIRYPKGFNFVKTILIREYGDGYNNQGFSNINSDILPKLKNIILDFSHYDVEELEERVTPKELVARLDLFHLETQRVVKLHILQEHIEDSEIVKLAATF